LSYEYLTLERRDNVAVITLNRPEKLNALNRELQNEGNAVLDELAGDDSIRAAIVTGAGRGFCSGADLTSGARTSEGVAPQRDRLDEYGWVGRQATSFYRFPKPLIAAVNGVAAGAGMSMALACDIRIGSSAARFKTVFLERSLSPDSGMSFFLPRIVGYSRAADLIYTSRGVDADEAYRIGLLDKVVPEDSLIEECVEYANMITSLPPVAMQSAKRVLQNNAEVGLDEALRYESAGLGFAQRAPHDVVESRASFVERRAPDFTGE